MSLTAIKMRLPYLATLFVLSALTAGCTTSPTSGRTQFNILPAEIESGVSDLRFSVKTALAAGDYCRDQEGPCAVRETAEQLAQRIAPIAERLGSVAPQLSPELVTRVPRVEVFVIPNDSLSVGSSAGGKIAVGSGLARLDLSDTDLALALSREFGRLAAAHHRESTSAGLAVSLVTGSPLVGTYIATSLLADVLFPMGTLLKVGISLLGSMGTEQLVEASQQEEADEFAGKLMLAAGYDLRELAEARTDIPDGAIKLGWMPRYFTSRAWIAEMAPPLETTAENSTDREPPPETAAGIAASLPETTAAADTSRESLLLASDDVAASPTGMTTTAFASQAPPPLSKAEIVEPVLQAAALKPQDVPPRAKPAVAKKAPKSATKKTRKTRRPPKGKKL